MRPSPESLAEAERWVLAEPFRVRRGRVGDRLGTGTGSSMEFQDHRAYVVGDDIRQVDWRAYGRSDQLLVRQYREEIAPRVDLFLDSSASMAVGLDKAALAVELPLLLWRAARSAGMGVSAVALGDVAQRLSLEEVETRGVDLTARSPLVETLSESGALLTNGSLRILISDLLFPHDPTVLCERLARGAGGLLVIQLLGQTDMELATLGGSVQALRLEDPETGQKRDLILDDAARARYLKRLERQTAAVREALQLFGGSFLRVTGGKSLGAIARQDLVPAGVLVPS